MFKSTIFLVLVLFAGSCSEKTSKKEDSLLLSAYRLIDEGRMDEAITILETEIDSRNDLNPDGFDESPDTNSLRVTLASAYAKKSGITIREIARSVLISQQISNLSVDQLSFEKKSSGVDNRFKDVAQIFLTQFKAFQTLTALPKVEEAKFVYLSYAVKLINSMKELPPSDLLYRVILKIIFIKSKINSDEFRHLLPAAKKENDICVVTAFDFADALLDHSRILLSAFEDLQKALPQRKDQFVTAANQITDWIQYLAAINAAGNAMAVVQPQMLEAIYAALNLKIELECR